MRLGLSLALTQPRRLLGGAVNPVDALFSSGQQGARFDGLNSFAKASQDTAGATPVTAIQQLLGRFLDSSGRNNHALQGTAGSRPALSARRNLIIGSELDNVFTAAGAGSTINKTFNAGVTTLAKTGTGGYSDAYFLTPSVNGQTHTRAMSAEIRMTVGNPTTVAIATAQDEAPYGLQGFATLASKGITTGGGWVRIDTVGSLGPVAAGVMRAPSFYFDPAVDGNTIEVRFPQTESGGVARAYQRNISADVYDLAGYPHYWDFDGVDDFFASASGGGGNAGMYFCAAFKPLVGAGAVRTLFSDRGANTGYRVGLTAGNTVELSAGNGAAITSIQTPTGFLPEYLSLFEVWDDGATLNAQLDGAAVGSIARPAVAAGTAGFTIGRDNGAATSHYAGGLYASLYRQGVLTVQQRADAKAYVRAQAGL